MPVDPKSDIIDDIAYETGIDRDEVEKACKSQFALLARQMKGDTMESVRFKHLGSWQPHDKRIYAWQRDRAKGIRTGPDDLEERMGHYIDKKNLRPKNTKEEKS